MSEGRINIQPQELTSFESKSLDSMPAISCIGSGSIGGKASGLAFIEKTIALYFDKKPFPGISVSIPRFIVIATDYFDRFLDENDLRQSIRSNMSDEYIAHAFGQGKLPRDLIEKLQTFVRAVNNPLAVRSSSLLEDAMYEPFAGVYATKMIPNNQGDIETRLEKLKEAIKFVYASTFFKAARDYHRAINRPTSDEKMAVIIQDIVGRQFNGRYYPDISGVARSYNFYPMGSAKPEEGVVSLALGLGKTIVDGGQVWSYSPAYPRVNPPVGGAGELLKVTQTKFWAVNMKKPSVTNPMHESEYLVREQLSEAEADGSLQYVASTYRPQDDRIIMGAGVAGPRIITFSPILVGERIPLNGLLIDLLNLCEKKIRNEVEIEFAVSLKTTPELSAQLGFLQVRPMVVSDAIIDVTIDDMLSENTLVASDRAMGNGKNDSIKDIVYVNPEKFNAGATRQIARELALFNRKMVDDGLPYLLIGFGRWGSSDPWLGIPVNWGQISGAKAIVEATIPGMDVDLSQGAHFFHNMTSFRISYFSVNHHGKYSIRWDWLRNQELVNESEFVRHVRLATPLMVRVDGRSGRGVILK